MNRLAGETSPYLLQHADNPVDWYPWGEEAFERARAENRPILLSIGYSACHWCHVMEHESFEDDETARLMNERFVNVKVDREERPDVDALYMDAVVALTGHGGWPMTVFLNPEGEPFFGGTYFPPEPRHGMPAFRDVLTAVSDLYRDRPEAARSSAGQLVEALRASSRVQPSGDPLTEGMLAEAARALRHQFDPEWGGFGGAPKFPPSSVLEFLLRMHLRGDDEALPMVAKTLDAMAAGGMYDLLGGGFHRYSVDRQWLVPHFEKMLYDNALLASAYLHAWALTGEERYRRVVEETLDYVLRELALPEGGLASAQDADTDGVEGLTFTWTAEESVPEELLHPFEHGRSIIRGELDEELRRRLWELREQRPKPARDDKAIASWNGLALAALAEAGRRLDRRDYVEAARGVAEFLLGSLLDVEGRLLRTYREGRAKNTGFLEDYADVANGLLELHVATGELRWLEEANRLARLAAELFADEERGGFFRTPEHGEWLIARQKAFDDNPTPSGNSMLALVLLRLARIYGDDELERRAAGVFRLVAPALTRAPHAFGQALSALDLYFSPPRELAIVGPPSADVARA
ncbi:MAG TPA: thioredoxin domain-containing protein, partial [Gaiellaceae bacterium]|nr:thioredoxin domain-containing protein [Gaiellaceae bacterium]